MEKQMNVAVLGGKAVVCRPNKNKISNKSPDYIGNGVVIWENEVTPKTTTEEVK